MTSNLIANSITILDLDKKSSGSFDIRINTENSVKVLISP